MREDPDELAPLLGELMALVDQLERESGFEEALGPSYGKLGSFRSRRRERLVVKAPEQPIVALVLDGEKRFGAGGRARRGELVLIPARRSIEVTNVPASPRRPYRSFVVHVAPQVEALLGARYAALTDTTPPWAEPRARVLRPSRSTLLAVLHLARSLAEHGAHLDLLRHRLEDVLLSLLLDSKGDADRAPRSHVRHDPASAIRRLIRHDPSHAWRLTDVAARLGMSAPTLRRRVALARTSFREILIDERMRLARTLLRDRALSVTEVALRCGYQSPSKFAAQFERSSGASPRAQRAHL